MFLVLVDFRTWMRTGYLILVHFLDRFFFSIFLYSIIFYCLWLLLVWYVGSSGVDWTEKKSDVSIPKASVILSTISLCRIKYWSVLITHHLLILLITCWLDRKKYAFAPFLSSSFQNSHKCLLLLSMYLLIQNIYPSCYIFFYFRYH